MMNRAVTLIVPVEGLFALDGGLGSAVLEDEVDDERGQQQEDVAEVSERGPLLVFGLGQRRSRLRSRSGSGFGHSDMPFVSSQLDSGKDRAKAVAVPWGAGASTRTR